MNWPAAPLCPQVTESSRLGFAHPHHAQRPPQSSKHTVGPSHMPMGRIPWRTTRPVLIWATVGLPVRRSWTVEAASIDALDHLWAKKKEADTEKECDRAERIDLDKEKFEFKRMIEEDRILRLDTNAMSIEEQEYYTNVKKKSSPSSNINL
uniref:No apical meristem-associated C-terminal domain-containing protein n=1 Tax=Oryza punctata TaxID=4537 RepID=A0A0E0KGJ4_ORYPU